MKKSIFIITALLLSSALLVACSKSETNEEGTPYTTQTNELGTPVAGYPGTTTEPFTSTTPLATQPLGTEVPGFGTPAISQTETVTSTVGGGSALGSQQNDAGRVSNLLKFDVQDQTGNKIGTVSNLVLNLESQRVQYVIIKIGGALGIGGDQYAVPSALFEFPNQAVGLGNGVGTGTTGKPVVGTPAGSTPVVGATAYPVTTTTNEANYLILKADKAALDKAPKWSDDMLPTFGQSVGDWDSSLSTYWNTYGTTGGTGVNTTAVPGTPAVQTTPNVKTTPNVGTTPAAPGLTVRGKLQGIILADKVIGMNIADATGNKIAEIKDIVIDTTNWKILYLVVEYNGANTGGTYLIPVPPAAFNYDATGKTLIIDNADTVLSAAPHFTDTDFPSTSTMGWDKDIKMYWDKIKTSP